MCVCVKTVNKSIEKEKGFALTRGNTEKAQA